MNEIQVQPGYTFAAVNPREYRALLDLYAGLHDAATNGTGYSPKVAIAMKTLKQLGLESELFA